MHHAEVVIAGGGLAGIVTALQLLIRGRTVLLIEKGKQEAFGGLAKESFGGVHLIDTPHQKKLGLKDSPELAWEDWERYACFEERDEWPRRWARLYCASSREHIFEFMSSWGVRFMPVVNWPERGMDVPGNSIPRWHIVWGTGFEIIHRLVRALDAHPARRRLNILFEHEVNAIEISDGRVTGVSGRRTSDESPFEARAEHVVIASGGICGGDLSKLRANWYRPWGEPPKVLLNGAHDNGDGLLHDRVAALGGAVTHLDKHWHYAAGIHHPARRRPNDGISLVPPRSALWLNPLGQRILNPRPLVAYTDTRYLVESVLRQPGQYSWQVLNRRIALKELAVSGCNYMTAFRYKNRLRLAADLLFGNRELIERLIRECPEDIVTAETLDGLVRKMNDRSLDGLRVDRDALESAIRGYDEQIERGPAYFNDEQLRRILNFRCYRGDRIRICRFQKILDPSALPLIAIREFILARKSLGGIQTDLSSRVLSQEGEPIPGLYAVGEAAGFGGGGIHGLRSLEGTFLGSCVLTGRTCADAIAGG